MSNPIVTITMADGGVMTGELYPELAPNTVNNFIALANAGYYDGLIFHRVIKDFMVQGGGFDKDYTQRATRAPVQHEGQAARAKGLSNVVGTIAMARTNDPNSATSQFFINTVDNSKTLDPVVLPDGDPVTFEFRGQTLKDIPRQNVEGHPLLAGYTVFGKVVSGMDTVEKIRNTPTGAGGPFPTDAPQKMVIIESARLLEASKDTPKPKKK